MPRLPRKGRRNLPSKSKPRLYENEFRSGVIKIAEMRGWKVATFYDSRLSHSKGFPDCTFVREDPKHGCVVIFMELKVEKGTRTPEQLEYAKILSKSKHENIRYYVATATFETLDDVYQTVAEVLK